MEPLPHKGGYLLLNIYIYAQGFFLLIECFMYNDNRAFLNVFHAEDETNGNAFGFSSSKGCKHAGYPKGNDGTC